MLLTLGTPGEAGDPPTKFTEPNDVLVAPDGSIFVAEAHNAQFLDPTAPARSAASRSSSADGKFIKSWGPSATAPSQFRGAALAGHGFQGPPVRRRSRQPPHPDLRSGRQAPRHLVSVQPHQRALHRRHDTLYAIDSESDDNYNPGWRKGLRVGSARTGEVWYFVPEHVSKQPSGMGGYGSMGEGVDGRLRRATSTAARSDPIQGLTKFVPRLKR